MTVEIRTKAIVSVAEMARMCGLSRARFYQLVKEGVFPPPLYRIDNRRPYYVEAMQEVCLEVRRRNCGINGRPVMFYARRFGPTTTPKRKRTPAAKMSGRYNDLVHGLKALGLASVSTEHVETAVKELFPDGIQKLDSGEMMRTVFLHLRRQDSGDNLG